MAGWDAETSDFKGDFLGDEYGVFTDPKTGLKYIGGKEFGSGLKYTGRLGARSGFFGGRKKMTKSATFEAGSAAEMAAYRRSVDNQERGKDLWTDRYKKGDIGGDGFRFSKAENDESLAQAHGYGGIPGDNQYYSKEDEDFKRAHAAWVYNGRHGPEPEPKVDEAASKNEEFNDMRKRQAEWYNETTLGNRGQARKSLMDLMEAGKSAQEMARNYKGWGAGRRSGNRPRRQNPFSGPATSPDLA